MHITEVAGTQRAFARRAGEHRHQLGFIAVFAHQHGREFLADFHQVSQVGDVVFGNQVFHHADALKARACPQRFTHFAGFHTRHLGDGGVGFRRVADFELHQNAAQITLVTRQCAIQQQRPLGAIQLQQAGQRIDVFLDQCALLFQRVGEPVARDRQQGDQVLGLVFGVFIQIEKQRAFFIGAAPGAVFGHEGQWLQRFLSTPGFIGGATALQKGAQACQQRHRPHQVAA